VVAANGVELGVPVMVHVEDNDLAAGSYDQAETAFLAHVEIPTANFPQGWVISTEAPHVAYYSAPDCSGPRYLRSGFKTSVSNMLFWQGSNDARLYQRKDTAVAVTIKSRLSSSGNCTVLTSSTMLGMYELTQTSYTLGMYRGNLLPWTVVFN
jgi:hypothetical protein